MKIDSPCRFCKTRILGCHDICNEYSRYRSEVDEQRETMAKEKSHLRAYDALTVARHDRSIKGKKMKDRYR